MDLIAPGLHLTAPLDLGFGRVPLQARAALLVRPDHGNVLLYGAAAALPELDAVRDVGGVARQYLNHAHEATAEAAQLRDALGAPVHVHAADADEVARTVSVDATFTDRHHDGDLEVVPVPGHTPGATAYVWDDDGRRVLFTGDTLFVRGGQWVAALLDGVSDRERYVESLHLLAALEPDLLVPGVAPVGETGAYATDPADARRRIEEVAARLEGGADQ
ncbi:MBL fold metallo-hydrolase [Conexibacter sp. SYSU D00693]|uniref:MBL fold metallo-hydrolase n=1 Tax=Conexibacter sp. SYSU D00693 TaxID=2812560 RepID=UPI00196A4BC4|nr:MBL fold metallo-hydrolase [Conexibacter sp. SYSU D00693]